MPFLGGILNVKTKFQYGVNTNSGWSCSSSKKESFQSVA